VLVSAYSTMTEDSRATIQLSLNFLTGEPARVSERLPWANYDMLTNHMRTLELASS
jgi:hypothetical protein